MPKEAIPAVIALVGVVLSIAVSLLTSRTIFRNETRKFVLEARRAYDSKLLETRLNFYPGLYLILSKFAKQIRQEPVSRDDIRSFLLEIDEWDSKNAILLSARTALICARLREVTLETCLNGDLSNISTVEDLIKKIGVLELALKSDLGVFGIEDAGLETKIINSYYEIWRMYDSEAGENSSGFTHSDRERD